MKKSILTLIAAWALLCPHQAEAQKVYRIGALVADDLFVPAFEGFKKKMAELGYIEGENIRYDFRNAKWDRKSLKRFAQMLVQDKPDLIVTASTTATLQVAKATRGTDIPVVFLGAGNPLLFAKSYASSGNNLTGISSSALQLIAKRLELLKELAPWVKRVASFNNPKGVNYQAHLTEVRRAAKMLGFTLWEINVTNREEIQRIIPTITRKVADAIFLPPDRTVTRAIDTIVKQALKEKLLLIPLPGVGVESGGLATYGHDYFEMGQQGAMLVDKILKGAKPMNLPIEQPLRLKLMINLKTAKAIGLKIPNGMLLRADEVVE